MVVSERTRLVVFDVEGVLIPKNRFLYEAGKNLGLLKLIKLLFYGFLYEAGLQKLQPTLTHIFQELKGQQMENLVGICQKISSVPLLQSIGVQLKARNCKIALISSGLPTMIVKKLADTMGAEYAYGIDVEKVEGKLTGKISGDAIEPNGKLKILTQIMSAENVWLSDCVVVADDRNNSCIFMPGVLKVGFNPDFVIRIKADKVVIGKLSQIFPVIDGITQKRPFPTANDFLREDIHASGFFMPIIATLIGVPIVAALIITISLVYTGSELLRLEGKELPLISAITQHSASQSELNGFAAAPLYFAFGILLTLVLFNVHAGGAAVAMFCLGDSAASLFGGRISKNPLPFNKGKTWEGSVGGFFFAFLAGLFFVSPTLALIGAAVAMTVEALPLPINDNVLVPVVTGAVLTLLMYTTGLM
jgi:dolichol kinase/phosphoserine phosphatase